MKKLLILITILLITLTGFAQTQNVINWDRYGITGDLSVGKGNANRNDSNAYPPRGVYFQVGPDTGNKAMLPPRILHPDSISNPLIGMIAFSYSDSSLKVYDGLDWVALNSSGGGGSSYVFSNGLTDSLGEVKLGGVLTGNVEIEGDGNTFIIKRSDIDFPGNQFLGSNTRFSVSTDVSGQIVLESFGGTGVNNKGARFIVGKTINDGRGGMMVQLVNDGTGVDATRSIFAYDIDYTQRLLTDNLSITDVGTVKKIVSDSLQYKSDSSTISNDSLFYWVRGVPYYGGSFSGGSGGVDTATIQSIIEDSLSGVIRQGGNSFGVAMDIGTNDNQDVILRRNNAQFARFGVSTNGFPAIYLTSATTSDNLVSLASSSGTTVVQGLSNIYFSINGMGGSNVRANINNNGMSVGYTNSGAPSGTIFRASGNTLFENGTMSVKGNSTTVNPALSVQASDNSVRFQVNNNGSIITPSIGTSLSFSGVYVRNGDSLKSVSISQFRDSLPFVPEGTYLTYTDPNDELIPADNSVIVVTLTTDASIILPDNPPVKSRAIIKVFGSANALAVTPSDSGTIDEDPNIIMSPKEGKILLHIGSNDWIIINQ